MDPKKLNDMSETTPEYEEFVEKFKPKRTTDDCYTPENVYEVIADWVANEYGLDKSKFVRPFWPGGDYEHYDYPVDCVVVDNPPFSLVSKIYDFYIKRGIKFFLFAPGLTTLYSAIARGRELCVITTGLPITYDNGAVVRTSFVTNLDQEYIIKTAPELFHAVDVVNKQNERIQHAELPKYTYPLAVFTAAAGNQFARCGVDYRIRRGHCRFAKGLDSQKQAKKEIYGGGLLLSERAQAERAQAERAQAERKEVTVWELSDREQAIIDNLGGDA